MPMNILATAPIANFPPRLADYLCTKGHNRTMKQKIQIQANY
jgi:hypothetical protein